MTILSQLSVLPLFHYQLILYYLFPTLYLPIFLISYLPTSFLTCRLRSSHCHHIPLLPLFLVPINGRESRLRLVLVPTVLPICFFFLPWNNAPHLLLYLSLPVFFSYQPSRRLPIEHPFARI